MELGVCFPRELPAAMVIEVAERLDGAVDQLWVVEDCFFTAGVSLAAAALARTERLKVGIGIMPAVVRSPALTAMELATLDALAPGRVIGGIGHGVQDWMAQIGLRPASPVTALAETIDAVRRLLRGERLTVAGDYVNLADVQLDAPPSQPPPILAGVRGPKSLAAAGRVADGVLLAEFSGPHAIRAAIADAGTPDGFSVAVYTATSIGADAAEARSHLAPMIAAQAASPPPGLVAMPFFSELADRVERDGPAAVASFPDEWWVELAAAGTPEQVNAHLDALDAAGATTAAMFLPPLPDAAREQLDAIVDLCAGRS